MKIKLFIACMLIQLLSGGAAYSSQDWYSPRDTDEYDLVLPLGEIDNQQWSIVLRRIEVPGREFWLSGERFIDLGQGGDVDVYERPVSVEIRGVTRADKNWLIWLGKYEVSIGQYAYIMGDHDLRLGLESYNRFQSTPVDIDELISDPKALNRFLAKPVQRVPPSDISEFIRRLNQRCYIYKPCRDQLPAIGHDEVDREVKYLPFFRLPNEIEWEYAVRGVSIKPSKYRDKLPVSKRKLDNYAQLQKVRSIGKKKSLFGFYDMFGNVAELISDRMSPEIGVPGSGARLAKGGKALKSFSREIYSSLREEVVEFEWHRDSAIPKTTSLARIGFRLALGTPLTAFSTTAERERPSSDSSVSKELPKAGGGMTQDFTVILDSLSTSRNLNREQLVNLTEQLATALERLQIRETKVNTRMASVIGDNTLTKLVRIWAVLKEVKIRDEVLDKYVQDPDSVTARIQARLTRMEQRNEQDTRLIGRLQQEYEIALRALSDIPGVSGDSIDLIDLKTFEQSEDTALLASAGVKLLRQQLIALQRSIPIDIGGEVMSHYPL